MATSNNTYAPGITLEQNIDASGHLSQLKVPATSNLDTPQSYEQSRRQVSSVVVAEEILGARPENHKITYVEVPVVQEVTKYVPKVSVVEVEKIVPKYETEEREEIVEVPQIEYIERRVEKIVQHEPGTKLIEEVTKEVVKHVPKIEYRQIEQIIEIPGEEIEVPIIKRDAGDKQEVQDQEIPVVVAQTIRPVLTEVYDKSDRVDVYQYNPTAHPVDVLVPKPVQSHLIVVGAVTEEHKPVAIPTAHYNTILKQINQHLPEEDMAYLPCQVDPDYGKVTFLHASHTPGIAHYPEMDLAAVEQAQKQQHKENAELQHMGLLTRRSQYDHYDPNLKNEMPQAHGGENNIGMHQPRMLTMTSAQPQAQPCVTERLHSTGMNPNYNTKNSSGRMSTYRSMSRMNNFENDESGNYAVDGMMEEGLINQPVTVDYVPPKPRGFFGAKRLGCGC